MFMTDAGMWKKISEFARSLGVREDLLGKAKTDFKFVAEFAETQREIHRNHKSQELNESISWQNFHNWIVADFFCFYTLLLSGFRHTAPKRTGILS